MHYRRPLYFKNKSIIDMKETFTKWFNENKEFLRDEYRSVKASMKIDFVVDIPNLREWAREQYNSF